MSILLAAAASAALLLAPAAPPASEATDVEAVVVTARQQPARDAITGFVASVSAESGNGRLARWDRKVCPGTIGLKPVYAQMMIDRIAATAVQVGLEVGEPGCKANMIIVGTDNSPALVANIVKENPDAFGKFDGGVSRGRRHLEAFVVSEEPVRWWHVTTRVSADGEKYSAGESIRIRDAGRLHATTRDDFSHVVIVMDARRMGALKIAALADYIAMVGLAQIEPEAKTDGVPTILNLFADKKAGLTPAEGLTDWDIAYLKGLYAARRDAPRGAAQERDVVRTMSDSLGAAKTEGRAD